MELIVLVACQVILATRDLYLVEEMAQAQVVQLRTALVVCLVMQGTKAPLLVVGQGAGVVQVALEMMATSTRQWTAQAACLVIQDTKAQWAVAQGAGAGHLVRPQGMM